ncbi:glutathione S-transferase [Falsihalocynthiibacter arcticus]|uniref:Glutathione S-transferase n=1 Tax=Falsihalocynthiibacter arcticus TaxID=1579316 RepID=A0A126UZG8_9RHOB|nr:glutathione S-transferase [Falsihalocynthiibacter arcticus]AML51105.1 glutathione S-transferase [Falsihalocynthiibacter arcticus]
MKPLLYSFRRCPYAMRARLALASAQIPCELREILLRDKPEAMLEASPKGTVPVLILPNGVVDESLDIMIWALSQNDPEGWLNGQAEALALIKRSDGPFKSALDRYKYATRYEGVDSTEERTKASLFLQDLNTRLAHTPYLLGEHPTLADMGIVTFVRQFANVDRVWFDAQPWPDLIRWLETFLASPRFAHIMVKHPVWMPDTAGIDFP